MLCVKWKSGGLCAFGPWWRRGARGVHLHLAWCSLLPDAGRSVCIGCKEKSNWRRVFSCFFQSRRAKNNKIATFFQKIVFFCKNICVVKIKVLTLQPKSKKYSNKRLLKSFVSVCKIERALSLTPKQWRRQSHRLDTRHVESKPSVLTSRAHKRKKQTLSTL